MKDNLMEKIVSLCKRRGFVFPTSEIYGGLISSYDYGPVGAALIRNIRNLWWKEFIERRDDMVGLDSQIILHPRTWEASGHVANFNEPMIEDKKTNKRYRADHLIENWIKDKEQFADLVVENFTFEEMGKFIIDNKVKSPEGNDLSSPKKFNQLFNTSIGVIEDAKFEVYLRGETAQGIFSDFKNILDSTRIKFPFGVGQIGKSFRNEITTGQFVFRTLEFEQAEIEYFFDPEVSDWEKLMDEWKLQMISFVTKVLGIKNENLRWRRHTDKERSHYSKDTYDLDYNYPFGWKELWGIAYRTDYDLKQHAQFSGVELNYRDPITNKVFIPHVIEPAVGINRLFFITLCDAYTEEGDRIFLKFNPKIAPYKVAVFPLVANKPELVSKARRIYEDLKEKLVVTWDDRGNIGKRYYSQDEIGTPWCVTVDYQTLEDETVTVRDRDTATQIRMPISDLDSYFQNKLK
ncbi:MAG: glycine--tRNA ligase [Candidatus Amesbacteria bacterium]|nr:glycine--tRNA ligase [Candidatus Amesbacteria bacterium]